MKNWAPMKTTANDSWTASAGRTPIRPMTPSTIACAEFSRTKAVRAANSRTKRPRFFSRKYAVAEAKFRARVTSDPPSRCGRSAEFGDHAVFHVNDEVEREVLAVLGRHGDQDLGRAVGSVRVGREGLGAPDRLHA